MWLQQLLSFYGEMNAARMKNNERLFKKNKKSRTSQESNTHTHEKKGNIPTKPKYRKTQDFLEQKR